MTQVSPPQPVLPPAPPVAAVVEVPAEPKPGVYTTEFWLTLMNKAAGIGVLLIGVWRRDGETMILGAGLAGLSVGTYNMSRGMAKKH